MKLILYLLFFCFITANSYSCPLEPLLIETQDSSDIHWRRDPSLGVVVRFIINGSYVMYAHPEVAPIGYNFKCIPHPRGGCKTIVVNPELREIVFIDDNIYHTATITPIMCRMAGKNWESFYRVSYGRRIK